MVAPPRLSPKPTQAPPRSASKLAEMARRARRGLSLFHDGDADLPDDMGLRERRSRNGAESGHALVDARGNVVDEVRRDGVRERSERELKLSELPTYRRREVLRKRALRASRRGAPAELLWSVYVPSGRLFTVAARTKGEARALAKRCMKLRDRDRLPPGTLVRISLPPVEAA